MDKGELQVKIEKNQAQLRAMLDKAEKEKRDLTDVETATYDGLDQVTDMLQAQLDGLEGRNQDRAYQPSWRGGTKPEDLFARKFSWSEIFGREPRPLQRKLSLAEIVTGVKLNDLELLKELRESPEQRTMLGGQGTLGGFLVPEQIWANVFNSALEESVTMDLVTKYPMISDTLRVVGWDSEDHSGGQPIGGVAGQWIPEAGTATRRTPTLRTTTFNAQKLAIYVAMSNEAAQDAPSLSNSLGWLMRNSLAWSVDDAIINGSGVGQPTGILNCGATVSVARAAAGAISLADLANVYGSLLPSSMQRAVWLMSPSAYASLLDLESTGGMLILSASGTAAARTPQTLFGAPIRVSEKCPALSSRGDVMCVDLSYYGLAMREVARFESTNAAQFMEDLLDVRCIWRLAGTSLVDTSITMANGDVLSPFVVLD